MTGNEELNTDLRHSIMEAQHNAEQLRLLADALPVLIAYLDAGLRLVFVNAAYGEWFELNGRAMCGSHLRDLVGERAFAFMRPHCEAALAGRRVTCQQRLEHRREGWRDMHVTLEPYVDEAGGARGFYMLATDVTDQKRRERSLLKSQAEIGRANRLASMSEFAATVRHQLGQPLTAIANYAGALRNGYTGDRQIREVAGKIVAQTRTARDILKQLHDFTDRRPLDYGPADPDALVRQATALTEGRTESIGARVELRLPPGLPRVRVAPGQLQQVLVNLLINALDAMAKSEVRRLSIVARRHGDCVDIRIADTGCGIAAHQIERLFDAFHTTKEGGMGMGLAICRGIVADYGGQLWAESPGEGAGSTFHLRLPIAAERRPHCLERRRERRASRYRRDSADAAS